MAVDARSSRASAAGAANLSQARRSHRSGRTRLDGHRLAWHAQHKADRHAWRRRARQ